MKQLLAILGFGIALGMLTQATDASAKRITRVSGPDKIEQKQDLKTTPSAKAKGYARGADVVVSQPKKVGKGPKAKKAPKVKKISKAPKAKKTSNAVLQVKASQLTLPRVIAREDPRTPSPVPEPTAALVFGAGLLITGSAWRKRR